METTEKRNVTRNRTARKQNENAKSENSNDTTKKIIPLKIEELSLDSIIPDPLQPRKSYNEVKLQGLANSFKEFGVLQPITVRKSNDDYIIVMGERRFRASKKVCLGCSFRASCLGRSAQEKKFSVTYYREEYECNNQRVNSPQGRYMKAKRQDTVEPVLGTLTQFMDLRKVNTIGLRQANKCMHLAAIAYNLKKYLKFEQKHTKSGASAFVFFEVPKTNLLKLFLVLWVTPRRLTVAPI